MGYADSVSQILLRRGEAEARAELQRGDAWAGMATQLGQIPGQVMAHRAQQAEQQQRQADAAQRRELQQQQIADHQARAAQQGQDVADKETLTKQDAALRSYFADLGDADPDLKKVSSIVGPERGTKIAEGMINFRKLQRGEYDNVQTVTQKVLQGFSASTDAQRAAAYPHIKEELIKAGVMQPGDAPDVYDPQWYASRVAYGKEQAKIPTREIKTRNADGSERTQIVEDTAGQSFDSAAPLPAPKGLQSENFLLDGKPVKGTFNPTDGTYQHQGEDVTARVKPIPAGSTHVSLGGMNAMYTQTDPKAIAAGIRRGEFPPDISQYGRPVQGAIASELAKPGPNQEAPFNLSNAQRIWAAQKRLNATMNGGQQVRLDESIKSGLAMYDRVDDIADRWKGQGLGALSRANLKIAKEGGLGKAAAQIANELEGQIGQLTSDIATIEQGGLTPTNEARKVAELSMQAWWGTGTIKAMTAQGRANMRIRETARTDQTPFVGGNTGPQGQPLPTITPAAPAGDTMTIQNLQTGKKGRGPRGPVPPGWKEVAN
jgi:hypothetical protein